MIYIFIFLASFILTYGIKRYAIYKDILDHPNERSSHDMPTPKAGGLAIIISFFAGLFYLYFSNEIEEKFLFAFLCSIPLIVISFLDDLHTLSAKLRFSVQVLTVSTALYFIGSESLFLNILFALGMLWLINLYNFLDGIDGYAVSEVVFISFASYLIFQNELLLLLGISALGFLPFNWQKASIFMGDVGSTFLGFSLGVMVVYYAKTVSDIVIWVALLAIFWVDATWTLYRRFKSGQKLTKAHKMHFFQRATQFGLTHQSITLYAMFINIVSFMLIYWFKESQFIYIVLLFYLIILSYIAKIIDKRAPFK
ncbi:MAG TPA: glycosyltransferase family 4 protein [Campylobacterales bacterium]|nr:glycosyltransferase family 4 protein [Campylobacterales bacterium]